MRDYVDTKYLELIKASLRDPDLETVRVLFPTSYYTECMLILSWCNGSAEFSRSRLADLLLRELRRSGLTDHTLWVERFQIHESRSEDPDAGTTKSVADDAERQKSSGEEKSCDANSAN